MSPKPDPLADTAGPLPAAGKLAKPTSTEGTNDKRNTNDGDHVPPTAAEQHPANDDVHDETNAAKEEHGDGDADEIEKLKEHFPNIKAFFESRKVQDKEGDHDDDKGATDSVDDPVAIDYVCLLKEIKTKWPSVGEELDEPTLRKFRAGIVATGITIPFLHYPIVFSTMPKMNFHRPPGEFVKINAELAENWELSERDRREDTEQPFISALSKKLRDIIDITKAEPGTATSLTEHGLVPYSFEQCYQMFQEAEDNNTMQIMLGMMIQKLAEFQIEHRSDTMSSALEAWADALEGFGSKGAGGGTTGGETTEDRNRS